MNTQSQQDEALAREAANEIWSNTRPSTPSEHTKIILAAITKAVAAERETYPLPEETK